MEARPCSCPAKSGADRKLHANGQDLPVYPVKAVDHGDGAERGIEIKDGGAPLAIYYVPSDLG